MYPKLYLAIDNCFASKRWTEPAEWADVIRDLGLSYVECSADTECDPLYMGDAYLKRWVQKVRAAQEHTGVHPANLYSGHGTYATLGLAHTDPEVRSRFLHDWLEKMVDTAVAVDAGLGFFCHAFSDSVLQDPQRYASFYEQLLDDLGALAAYGKQRGAKPIGLEQMYSPHQVPWTIDGAEELVREIYRRAGAPMYLTVDVGHQTGQRKFLRPNHEEILQILARHDQGDFQPNLWLGPNSALELMEQTDRSIEDRAAAIEAEMDRYPYLFAQYEDGDPYAWLRRLAGYSPIIHLQQTDGATSGHWPFTAEKNQAGCIHAPDVLKSIAECYRTPQADGMPPFVDKIYLTLEIFTGTSAINRNQLHLLKESIAYWRQYIPEDGLSLDKLL